MKKRKKIEYDLNSLNSAINSLDSNKVELGLSLLEKAVYLDAKLKELQEDIDLNGLNIEMCQGKYTITRANPSCNTYTAFIKNYTSIIKQINDLIPAPKEEDEENEFAL